MAAIVWDRREKVSYPRGGTFADSTEANAWVRKHNAKSGHHAGKNTLDVITVNVQAG